MSGPQYTTDTTSTNYSKFRIPIKTVEKISNYYQLGLEAFEHDLDEDPNEDPAFIIAILIESEHITNLQDCKAHWLNGWMDAYRNKYLWSATN